MAVVKSGYKLLALRWSQVLISVLHTKSKTLYDRKSA